MIKMEKILAIVLMFVTILLVSFNFLYVKAVDLNLTENTSKGNQEFPMYPTGANISATMKEETTSTIDGSEVVILVYEGEDAFTVVQSIIEPNKEMVVSEIDGTLESVLTGVAYSKNNYLIYVENNIKYSIYSKDLTISEKIEVAEGMEYSIMK